MTREIKANYIDIKNRKISAVEVIVEAGKIISMTPTNDNPEHYILPGFIDAHVHIESSMLPPSEFARLAVPHGTVGTVSDPHEIGNVLGISGVNYMIDDGDKVNFKFYFGAPSCVPATTFETAGAEITSKEVDELLQNPKIKYLTEMMNWPGVLFNDPVVFEKIASAKKVNKPVDGHAPGLIGEDAKNYIAAGISTDHECFTEAEALDKLKHGMKIIIREGSAAKNFDALVGLIEYYPDLIMFCSDDKHPDNLVDSHINQLVKRSLGKGNDLFKTLQAACINPVEHYDLDVGQLQVGDPADFILIDNLKEFNILETVINGETVAKNQKSNIERTTSLIVNNFATSEKRASDFEVISTAPTVNVIEALDGQLITNKISIPIEVGVKIESIVSQDVLKLAVVNRYSNVAPAVAFIKNFGFAEGAIASSVGHDSHNITAVGVDDESIGKAVNLVIKNRGGIAAISKTQEQVIPLPIAGLMSELDGYEIADAYTRIDAMAKKMGSQLTSPFMTLSFMALLVIPHLKLSDKGLFDGDKFEFAEVFS